jgi:membrane protein
LQAPARIESSNKWQREADCSNPEGRMRVRRWPSVLKSAIVDAQQNHTMVFAAGLSYYFVLSLFPALIATSVVVSLLPGPDLFNQMLAQMSRIVPADSMGVVRHVLQDIMNPHRGALLSVGLIGAVWTASSGFAGMIEALNVAYDVPETRPFWKTRGLAVLMTFVVGGLVLVALGMMLVGPDAGEWLARALHFGFVSNIWTAARWTVSGAFIVVAVESVYILGPNVELRLGHTLAGAVFAVAAWLTLSYALGIYFQRFANLNRTYGALGGVIGLMTWLYWSFFVILLGAGINAAGLRESGDGTLRLKQTPPEKVASTTAPEEGRAA